MTFALFGPVDDGETLGRVVCNPRHIKKGRVLPSLFPPSHIKAKQLSVNRLDRMSTDEAQSSADHVGASQGGTAVGYCKGSCGEVRAIEVNGQQPVLVLDDPIHPEGGQPGNPAHAVVGCELSDEDISEVKVKLIVAFGPLVRFSQDTDPI